MVKSEKRQQSKQSTSSTEKKQVIKHPQPTRCPERHCPNMIGWLSSHILPVTSLMGKELSTMRLATGDWKIKDAARQVNSYVVMPIGCQRPNECSKERIEYMAIVVRFQSKWHSSWSINAGFGWTNHFELCSLKIWVSPNNMVTISWWKFSLSWVSCLERGRSSSNYQT